MTEEPTAARADLVGPGIMLLNAAILGYFGFGSYIGGPTLIYKSVVTGQLLWYMPVLHWTFMVGAVASLAAAMLAFVAARGANIVFSLFGVLCAIGFASAAIGDILDTRHACGIPIILLVFIAGWEGFWSWAGLKAVLSQTRSGGPGSLSPEPVDRHS